MKVGDLVLRGSTTGLVLIYLGKDMVLVQWSDGFRCWDEERWLEVVSESR